jgi:hypothetical protein
MSILTKPANKLDPIRPMPPMTAIFIIAPFIRTAIFICHSYSLRPDGTECCDTMPVDLQIYSRSTSENYRKEIAKEP